MNEFVMAGAEDDVLLHHMAFYGLADILQESGVTEVMLVWDGTRPVLTGDRLDRDTVDAAVRAHIHGRRRWVEETTEGKRATLSPRLTELKTKGAWLAHQAAREQVLDALTETHAWTDLRYLAALGEPAYWRLSYKGEVLQDDGASRLEMQPRNRGAEFVGARLRPLANVLLKRPAGGVVAGLDGSQCIDEIDTTKANVTATGLATPGPVDSALAWCALWGIGQFLTTYRISSAAATNGHTGRPHSEWFYTPVWAGRWSPARLRTIIASRQLRDAALSTNDKTVTSAPPATSWLSARGVVGIFRFKIGWFGTDNAPERRALRGETIRVDQWI